MSESIKIYIDIQSLLEMRQSCLIHLMGQDAAIAYIHTEDYYLREIDDFPVDHVAYEQLLAENAPVTLSRATVTYMLSVLTNRLSQSEKMNAFNDTKGQGELIVNTYPHRFTDGVLDRFKNALFMKLDVPVTITMVCEPLPVWTPSFIKLSGISQFYCYNGAEWLEQHAAQVSGGALQGVRLCFPTLGRAKLDKLGIKALQKTGFKDIFAYTEFLFAQFVKVEFLPVVFYSNLITASAVLETFNESVKKTPLNPVEEGVSCGDIIHPVQVP
jgi:hypothetical protein